MKKFLGHLSSIKENLWCWTIWFQRLSKEDCYTLFCTWITIFFSWTFLLKPVGFQQKSWSWVGSQHGTFLNIFSSSINESCQAFCDGCHPRRQFVLKVPINSCQPHFQLKVFERNAKKNSLWPISTLFLAGSHFQSLQAIPLDLLDTSKPKRRMLAIRCLPSLNCHNNSGEPVLRLVASTQEVKLEMLEDEDVMIRWD